MEVNVINDIKGLETIKESWERLEKISENVTFYNTYQYVYRWLINNQSKIEKIYIVCVSERNEIIGIAPLMVTNEKVLGTFWYKKLSFLGKGDFLNFLIETRPNPKSIITKIFETINKFRGWDKVDLTHLNKGSVLFNFLLRSSSYNSNMLFFGENPIVIRKKHDGFLNYKKHHIRKNVNNYYNKLRKNFDVQVNIYQGNEDDVLKRISEVHIERNQDGKKRKSLFEQPETMTFLESIYSHGQKTLTFCLENKNDIISYVTCFIHEGNIHAWNNSYNTRYEKYSPGDIIYMEAMKYFFSEESPYVIFDFGGGRYPWKFQMTNDFISMYRFNMNNKESKKYRLLNWYDKIFQVGKILLKK